MYYPFRGATGSGQLLGEEQSFFPEDVATDEVPMLQRSSPMPVHIWAASTELNELFDI